MPEPPTAPAVLWFRRDLRLHDHPALLAAADAGPVLPLFVVDPALWDVAGTPRLAYLSASLRALDADLRERYDARLVVRHGDPVTVLPEVVGQCGAGSVHVSADSAPYGRRRDDAVQATLDAPLVRTGSPYAVAPGRVLKDDGTPYQVYTPFYRAWRAHGWRAPAPLPKAPRWAAVRSDALPQVDAPAGLTLPDAGEAAARRQWSTFRAEGLDAYAERRDRPDLDGTSSLSTALKFGEVHPRTLLDGLGESKGHETFRRELAWREFYADVLWSSPRTAREYLRPELAAMRYDSGRAAEAHLQAWQQGRTGYPVVDAGMRQLQAEGWVHNRVRMIVASFLVKDLHLEWTVGARWFMRWLRDGDVASNQHGWQWVAGTGTDAAPYFRVFNPVTQGLRYDPDGDYVRRYVPELAHLGGAAAHEPWRSPDGYAHGYPERVVDHAEEREEALRRLAEVRAH